MRVTTIMAGFMLLAAEPDDEPDPDMGTNGFAGAITIGCSSEQHVHEIAAHTLKNGFGSGLAHYKRLSRRGPDTKALCFEVVLNGDEKLVARSDYPYLEVLPGEWGPLVIAHVLYPDGTEIYIGLRAPLKYSGQPI